MRPREREQPDSTPPASPTPDATVVAPRSGGGLSSMVVCPSDSAGAGSDHEAGGPRAANQRKGSSPPARRRESPSRSGDSPLPSAMRRRNSPLDPRRRQSPPPGVRRRGSPMDLRRRGSPMGFIPRSQRFHGDLGYGMRAGSISPPRRNKPDYYDADFDHPVRPGIGRGFQGGRGGGRFRDVSPHGIRRGSRMYGRGYSSSGCGQSPFEGEVRNDPNLSPREGDWICRNPTCGNLNFARRTSCNKCNEVRFGPGIHGPSHSPWRDGFYSPPLPRASPPRFSGPYPAHGMRREMNGYNRSPPRDWRADDPRDFGSFSPPRRGGRFPDNFHRDRLERYNDDYRKRRQVDRPIHDQWDRRDLDRDDFVLERRAFGGRSPSPRSRWVRDLRDRSRSPPGKRQLRGSFVGRGQGNRSYDDDSFMGRSRAEDSGVGRGRGRGRGYAGADDSFMGRRRGRGRKDDRW